MKKIINSVKITLSVIKDDEKDKREEEKRVY